MLLTQVVFSIFSNETITEEELEEMKSQDMLDSMLAECTVSFPKLKVPLIDERDQYLSQKIKEAPGKKVVAVLGAAHIPGIQEEINKTHNFAQLSEITKQSKIPKIIAWTIPLVIIALIVYTFMTNPSAGMQQTGSWRSEERR